MFWTMFPPRPLICPLILPHTFRCKAPRKAPRKAWRKTSPNGHAGKISGRAGKISGRVRNVPFNVPRGVPRDVAIRVAFKVALDPPLDVRSLVPLGVETPTTIPKAERRLQFPDDADGGGLSTTPQSGRTADPQHTRMKDVSIRSGRHPKLAPPNSAACGALSNQFLNLLHIFPACF